MSWLSDLIHHWLHPTPVPSPAPVPPPSPASFRFDLLRLHNAERAKAGLSPLMADARLAGVAQAHATWMATTGYLTNTGGDGDWSNRIYQSGYVASAEAENIAEGAADVAEVMAQWMGSSGRRFNILDKRFRDVGFGMARDRNGVCWWCSDFGAP